MGIGKQWSYENWDKTVNYSRNYNAKWSTKFVLHFLVPSSICRKSKLLIAFCVSPPPSPLVVLLLLLSLLDIVLLPASAVAEDGVVAAVLSDTCNDLGSSDSCVRPRPRLQEAKILWTVIIPHSTDYFTFNTGVIFLKTVRQCWSMACLIKKYQVLVTCICVYYNTVYYRTVQYRIV